MSHIFDLKLFLKFLARNKTFTYINLFGFSISLMFVIFIAAYAIGEMTVDNFQEKGDHIYLMINDDINTPYELKEKLETSFPEIEAACRVSGTFSNQRITLPDRVIIGQVQYVDSLFFDLFSFKLLSGDRENVLQPGSVVISRSFAEKAFPGSNPLGEWLFLHEDSSRLIIAGIMEDISHSAIEYADMVVHVKELSSLFTDLVSYEGVMNVSYELPLFLYLRSGTDIDLLEEKLLSFLKENQWHYQDNYKKDLTLLNLKKVYLYPFLTYKKGLNQGNWMFLLLLIAAGCLVLSFGTINYTNLSLAQSVSRAKEVAVRRFLSASRMNIYTRLILEGVFFCLISYLIAWGLAFLFLPEARFLLDEALSLKVLFSPGIFLFSLLIIVFIGADAGNVPGLLFSRTHVNDILKGEFRFKTKVRYSKILLVCQYFLTILFVGISLTMYLQMRYMVHIPLGYKTENIMNLSVEMAEQERVFQLVETLKEKSFVKRVTMSGTRPPLQEGFKAFNENRNREVYIFLGDKNYMDFFGFEPIYQIHPEQDVQTYVTDFGMSELNLSRDTLPELNAPFGGTFFTGIIKDFHIGDLQKEPVTGMIQIMDPELFPMGITNVFIETDEENDSAKEEIIKIYEEIREMKFSGDWLIEQLVMKFFIP